MLLNTTSLSEYSTSFLVVFGIGLATLLGVILLFLVLSKIKFIKNLFSLKNGYKKIIFNIILGLILGIIFGFISWIDYWQKIPIFTFVNFALLAIFAYRYSLWIFLGAGLPEIFIITVLYADLMPHFSNNTFSTPYLTYIVFAYLILTIIGSILKIFNTKNKVLVIFISSFIGFVCLFFIIWLVTYLNNGIKDFTFIGIISLDVLFSWFSFLIYYLIFRLIFNFLTSYADILQSGNYAEPGIVNQKYGIKKINELIQKYKINFGYIVTFKLINEDEIITNYGLSSFYKIRKQWTSFLIKHFPFEKYMEFINKNNDYCLFIGIDENASKINLNNLYKINITNSSDDKYLLMLNNYLKKMPSKVIYNNYQINVPFKAFLSLYNVHSCKIDNLINFNDLSYYTYKNNCNGSIYIFNPKVCYNPFANYEDAEKIDALVQNNSFDVKFKEINNHTHRNKKFYNSEYINLNLLIFNKNDAFNYAKQANSLDIFKRYLASIELKKAYELNLINNELTYLIIDYPWSTLNKNEIDINAYLLKLEKYQIKSRQIILSFDLDEFNNEKYSYEYISKSILSFQENGFKIAFSNMNESNIKILQHIVPDFVIFDDSINTKNEVINEYYQTMCSFLNKNEIEIIY